ncbi:hypothetical protein MHU86_7384 [Fragilaria crotonensis]|nr:hypothetical protein MHU86_7384 [Fragilaria crotonensis]
MCLLVINAALQVGRSPQSQSCHRRIKAKNMNDETPHSISCLCRRPWQWWNFIWRASSLLEIAPTVSFLAVSDSPASPDQEIQTTPTTFPITSFSPGTTGGFQNLEPNCGDCFCIPDPDCLAPQPGLSDSFPDYVSSLYASFVATNSIPLQTDDGGDCYPFADSLQGLIPSTAYNETSLPQCQKPTSTDGYCAFVFEDSNANFSNYSQCEGRRYAMKTFETEDAVPSTASITHKGPCGVCSSAQDLAVRISSRDRMLKLAFSCGTMYYAGRRSFSTLVSCYRYAGFTEPCASLWSHLTATSGELCANECIGANSELNGDPPECALEECGACGQPFQQDFDDISGRAPWKSGFTEPRAHYCSSFYPLVHDPCPLRQDPTPAPVTKTSDTARSWGMSAAFTMVWLLFLG